MPELQSALLERESKALTREFFAAPRLAGISWRNAGAWLTPARREAGALDRIAKIPFPTRRASNGQSVHTPRDLRESSERDVSRALKSQSARKRD
ncbi:hypothetical protein [Paraburkholderia lycopersici]|uniref:hypothetical protein n=1 Tax=Paraburkholderia lycopersici TaxID=416944 RepID=UPI00116107FC|nr:hypothetical protein [Paraburkholderia lycopersici]